MPRGSCFCMHINDTRLFGNKQTYLDACQRQQSISLHKEEYYLNRHANAPIITAAATSKKKAKSVSAPQYSGEAAFLNEQTTFVQMEID